MFCRSKCFLFWSLIIDISCLVDISVFWFSYNTYLLTKLVTYLKPDCNSFPYTVAFVLLAIYERYCVSVNKL